MAYEIQYHAAMLSDRIRLQAFKTAIEETVTAASTVVDIGTGSGILASYAAKVTSGQVFAIEYFPETAKLARQMMERSGITNVTVVNRSSYHRPIEAAPDTLISETIGKLGPEENIVELCYEFCYRYPSVKTVVPARLELFAAPVFSQALEDASEKILRDHSVASHGGFDYAHVRDLLLRHDCSRLVTLPKDSAQIVGAPVKLAQYELGRSSRSDFSKTVNLTDFPTANGVHLYFTATLSPTVSLSSSLEAPLTHWGHSYLRRLPSAESLAIAYSSKTKQFAFTWEDK